MTAQYLNYTLKGGTQYRLFILRGIAAEMANRTPALPPSLVPADWRAVRANTPESHDALSQGMNSNVQVWYTHGDAGLRGQRYADEVVRLSHKGWFCDAHQDEKARGVVALLTHGRYIAGYEGGAGETVYFDKVHTDESDAARMADEHARVHAEQEKEYNERWTDARELLDNIESEREEIGRLFALRNHPRLGTPELREELNAHVRELRKMVERMGRDFADIQLEGK